MIVAIHQPNYLPWLGYFSKIASADAFVFLDNVQFSKNSITNRVRVLDRDTARWLTIPIASKFGATIDEVRPARDDWIERHLSSLRNFYAAAPQFRAIWPDIEDFYSRVDSSTLAEINITIIRWITERLGVETKLLSASTFPASKQTGDDRLIELVGHIAPNGTYLSGSGGRNYQTPAKFEQAGLQLRYTDFDEVPYHQATTEFVPGLSIIDAAFQIGWRATRDIVMKCKAT